MRSGSRNILLRIPSLLYGVGVGIRNFLYDEKILSGYKSSIPVICVGNLAVGGTGKTPHVELIIRMLREKYRVAVLTRGYGRVGKEPVVASIDDDASVIGDEPMQIKRKFPDLLVCVDGNRKRALRNLEMMPESLRPEVVLMDDGLQHRAVKPAYSIILTTYEAPFTRDTFLPYGNLRDARSSSNRADSIIVTHTPDDCKPIDLRTMVLELPLKDYQDVYFSRTTYGTPLPLFDRAAQPELRSDSRLVVIAGLADPHYFFDYVAEHYPRAEQAIAYDDHHRYSDEDLMELEELLHATPDSILLTTEKDAMRLLERGDRLSPDSRRRIWYLPIEVELSPKHERRLLRRLERAIRHNGLELNPNLRGGTIHTFGENE